METLTIWILIAILGVIIYMYPALIGYKTKEGFQDQQVSIPVATVPIITKGEMTLPTTIANPVTPITPSPNSGAGPSPDLDTLLRNIEQVVKVPTHTPDLEKDSPVQYTSIDSMEAKSVGAKAQPKESTTTKSQPSKPLEEHGEIDISGSLAQGKTFQSSLPKSEGSVKREKEPVIIERVVEKVVKVPRRCPPQRKCPPQRHCPDMRDYIRKDSIPCWACKLK